PRKRTAARSRANRLTSASLRISGEALFFFDLHLQLSPAHGAWGPNHVRHVVSPANPQRPARRRLLPVDRARPVADLLARRHRQSRAWRVLRDRRLPDAGAVAVSRLRRLVRG